MHRLWHCAGLSLLAATLLGAAIPAPVVAGGTPAGTIIECWSTATYTDAQGAYSGQVSSNVVQLTVADKAGVALTPPSTAASCAPGTTATFPAELRNTGNAPDSFSVTTQPPAGWGVHVYVDDNGDGQKQDSETTLVTDTASLSPDSVLKLVVCVSVPDSATPGAVLPLTVHATSVADAAAQAESVLNLRAQYGASTIQMACNPQTPALGSNYTVTAQLPVQRQVSFEMASMSPEGNITTYPVTSDATGLATVQMTGDISGDWLFGAQWDGADDAQACSGILAVRCQGPTCDVTGMDMLSIPLQPTNATLEGILDTPNPIALARWITAEQRYALFSPTDGIAADPSFNTVQAGQGFWIVSPLESTIAPSGRLVDQHSPFTIPVSAGWQQIGSPFLSSINWADVQVRYNGVTYTLAQSRQYGIVMDYAWEFVKVDGQSGYALVHSTLPGAVRTLNPWRGYWVLAGASAELILPPPASAAPASAGGGASVASAAEEPAFDLSGRRGPRRPRAPRTPGGTEPEPGLDETEWLVDVVSSCGQTVDSSNLLGVSNDQTLYAVVNPPRANTYEDAYFPAAYGSSGSGPFASDVRPEGSSAYTWNVEVASTNTTSNHTLRLAGLDGISPKWQFSLVDQQTGATVNLRSVGDYTFRIPSGGAPVRFQITATHTN